MRPPACRFTPTCSAYAVTAVERFGAVRGAGWPPGACCAADPGTLVGTTRSHRPLDIPARVPDPTRRRRARQEHPVAESPLHSSLLGAAALVRAVRLARDGPEQRPDLGPVDRLPRRHHPGPAVPLLHQAGAQPAQDAGSAAEDRGAAGEVQERPADPQPGDDEAPEGGGLQPARRLPADPHAGPGLHRAVPRAAADRHAAGVGALQRVPLDAGAGGQRRQGDRVRGADRQRVLRPAQPGRERSPVRAPPRRTWSLWSSSC